MIQPEQLGRPVRAAVFVGFGLIVAVWLLTALYFSRRMTQVTSQSAEINARYMNAQEQLSSVRAQILLGSVFVRDALLDPDPETTRAYRRRLEESCDAAEAALQRYRPVLDSRAEHDQMARLRGEVDAFRRSMLEVLGSQASRSLEDARALLQARVMPGRELVIQLEEQAQALNRRAFVEQQSAIADTYDVTERRIWQSLGIALAASLFIGLIATVYAGRLEDRVRRQRERDAESTRNLQRLSSKLLSAQEDERRNIARELHDEIGQALTAIKVELSLAERAVNGGTGAATALGDARKLLEGALQAARDLSHLLRPAVLDDLGLAAAVDSYLKGFARRHAIRVELVQEGMDERLDPSVETAVYRIVQEALTNVSKHAKASRCRIGLRRLARTLVVTVEDDGVGFDPAGRHDANGHGLGLLGIRERAAQLGGAVRLDSGPGKGTRLVIEMPTVCRSDGAAAQGEPVDAAGAAVSVAREVIGG